MLTPPDTVVLDDPVVPVEIDPLDPLTDPSETLPSELPMLLVVNPDVISVRFKK